MRMECDFGESEDGKCEYEESEDGDCDDGECVKFEIVKWLVLVAK